MDRSVSFFSFPAFRICTYIAQDGEEYVVVAGGSGYEYGHPHVLSLYKWTFNKLRVGVPWPSSSYRSLSNTKHPSTLAAYDRCVQSSVFTRDSVANVCVLNPLSECMKDSTGRSPLFVAEDNRIDVYFTEKGSLTRVEKCISSEMNSFEELAVDGKSLSKVFVCGCTREGRLSVWCYDMPNNKRPMVVVEQLDLKLDGTTIVGMHIGPIKSYYFYICIYLKNGTGIVVKLDYVTRKVLSFDPFDLEICKIKKTKEKVEAIVKSTISVKEGILVTGVLFIGCGPKRLRKTLGFLIMHNALESASPFCQLLSQKDGLPCSLVKKEPCNILLTSKSILSISLNSKNIYTSLISDLYVNQYVEEEFPPQSATYLPQSDILVVLYPGNFTALSLSLSEKPLNFSFKYLTTLISWSCLALIAYVFACGCLVALED